MRTFLAILFVSSAILAAVQTFVQAKPGDVFPITPAARCAVEEKHNEIRRSVAKGQCSTQPPGEIPDMKWDQSLADSAASYSKKCLFKHSKNRKDVGENLYMSTIAGEVVDEETAVDSFIAAIQGFADEHKFYIYGDDFSEKTGHYTQVIWAKSTRVGCALAECSWKGTPGVIVVCQYGPAGNVVGLNNKLLPPYEKIGDATTKNNPTCGNFHARDKCKSRMEPITYDVYVAVSDQDAATNIMLAYNKGDKLFCKKAKGDWLPCKNSKTSKNGVAWIRSIKFQGQETLKYSP